MVLFQKRDSNSNNQSTIDTPLRKSDRRKLYNQILQLFPHLSSSSSSSSSSSLGDDVLSYNGSDILQRKLSKDLILYLRTPDKSSSSSSNWPYQRTTHPLFVFYEKRVYPCLPILSLFPNILPKIYIHSHTSKFICNGANVMSVGILGCSQNGIRRGDTVCVAVYGNPIPFAVGVWNDGVGGIGVFVDVCYGDDLWRMQLLPKVQKKGEETKDDGNYGLNGFENGTIVRAIMDPKQETKGEEEGKAEEVSKEEAAASGTPSPSEVTELKTEATQPEQQDQDASSAKTEEEEEEDEEGNDPETILQNLFCQSLLSIPDSSLPMPISTYYSKYLLPLFHSINFELKSTPYKKILPFLKTQTDLISLRNDLLTNINRSNYQYRDAKKQHKTTTPSSSTMIHNQTKKWMIVNLYLIPKHLVAKLNLSQDAVMASNAKSAQRKNTGFLTPPECRDILESYISSNDLNAPNGNVKLNPQLTDLFFKKKNKDGPPPEIISKKDIVKQWMEKLTTGYALMEMPGNVILRMKKGSPSKIKMEVERRPGGGKNKFITRVRGLEEYEIDPKQFSQDIAKRFACSATIETEAPSTREKLKQGCMELSFQGNLVEELKYVLTNGEEGNTSHGGAMKVGKEYEGVPKGVVEVVLKKGVKPKKK